MGDMARVYELVVRHCIASVSKDANWRSTRVDFAVDSMNEKGSFTLRGKELVSPGFLSVLKHKGKFPAFVFRCAAVWYHTALSHVADPVRSFVHCIVV